MSLAGCWTASPRAEPLREQAAPSKPPRYDESEPQRISRRAVASVTRCTSSVAPLVVDVENQTSLDHDMCAAFAIRARDVAWPANLTTSSGYAIRVSLTQSDVHRRRDDVRFDCRVSMELTVNGQLLVETRDRGAAVTIADATRPPDAAIGELGHACIEAEVKLLLRRVVPVLNGHVASTGASQPNAPQPPPTVQPQPQPQPKPKP